MAVGGTPGVLDIPTVADRYPGEGPLGGVATALTYARRGWVLAATCDLPLLTPTTLNDLVDALEGLAPDRAIVAAVDGHLHPSLACWPASWSSVVHAAVRAGERRFRHLLDLGPIEPVEIAARSIIDADDRTTLASLLAHMPDVSEPEA